MADSYKLVVFGGAGVGKTSAVVQLIEKRYGALDSSWAHEDAHFVELVVDGEKAGISVYDTSTGTSSFLDLDLDASLPRGARIRRRSSYASCVVGLV